MLIDGTLKQAIRQSLGDRAYISGYIYGDTKGRFMEGDLVHTSMIEEELEDGIVRTRNSTYRVEWA